MKKTLFLMLSVLIVSITSAQDTIYVAQNATGLDDGSSWTNAYTNLQTANTAAVSGDEVWVAAGTYLPGNSTSSTFSLKVNVAMYGGFSGTEIDRSGIRDASISILSGDVDSDGTWSSGDVEHILDATESDSSTFIDGFTLEGGYSPSNWGAAITCYNTGVNPGGVSVNNCIFNRNKANFGGAIYIQTGSVSYMNFTNCIFSDNECSSYGGAIQNETAGYMNFVNCSFYKNKAGSGANVINDNTDKTSMFNCIVWGNYNVANTFYNTPIISNSIIEGGYASGADIINLDPLFMDTLTNDFRLQACSPAINKGSVSGIMSFLNDYDLDFSDRIVNTIDIGAYEYKIENTVSAVGVDLTTNATGGNLTYQWLNCDNNTFIAGITNNVYTVTTDGNYAVVVTDNSCQSDTSACTYVDVIVLVDSIKVDSETGDSVISTQGGTLQMVVSLYHLMADDTTFTWSVVDGTGSAMINSSGLLTAIADGTVTVFATANDASGVVDSKIITISNQSVGISENAYETLKVFPNPTTGVLNIRVDEDIAMINIIDYTGKVVKAFDGNLTQIDVSDLNKGIYFMEVENEFKKSIVKIMIK